ncbi:MAG: murein biosynthesis integral membrane protein MurJ [Candidatus Eisenbacteria bacterium]|nr:murein biosynthesis integral membrane protein MurJ [Candidatus Latescibacterota bacterium]MBD3301243.1 murein biosynthesis integral membrane protein MurJ [Candidatus Eisenbacteria bacterium]
MQSDQRAQPPRNGAGRGAGGGIHRRGLIRSAAQLGIGTFVSRLLGLGRDMSRAWLFGTGTAADAFSVAFRFPNLLRALFAEGALSAAFVPVFTRTLHEGDRENLEDFLHSFATLLLLTLVGVSLLGVVLAPLVVPWIVAGFEEVPGKIALTIRLTQLLFPYILLIGLATLAMGVLNSFGHFAMPALAPALMNVAMILGVVVVAPRVAETPERQIYALAGAVLVGGLLQGLIQLPPLLRRGLRPRFRWAFGHPGIRKVALLMVPGIFGFAVAEINAFVNLLLASRLEPGSVAALEYGQRVMQLPLGVFAVALGTAVLPTLSRQAAAHDFDALRDTYGFSLRMTWLILIPASVLLIVLARPLLMLLFARGAFRTGDSLELTTIALVWFSVGLVAYGSVKSLVPVFYAQQDTRTPVRCAALSMGANIVLAVALMGPMRLGGLALATAAASAINVMLLFRETVRRTGIGIPKDLVGAGLRFLLAGGACGVAAYLANETIPLPLLPRVLLALAAGGLADLVVLLLLRAEEPRDLLEMLRRRFGRSR